MISWTYVLVSEERTSFSAKQESNSIDVFQKS